MKEVVVVSGKGGTGKTTVLSLYARLAENAVIADCDVDAPNLGLVVNARVLKSEKFKGMKIAEIYEAMCNRCGACVPVCRFDAITQDDPPSGRIRMDPDMCEGCGVCARVCPQEAIAMIDREVGEWRISETNGGIFVDALLDPGAENSGKLVAMVKQQARMIAKRDSADLILIDGPPGIGCPVISALSGADIAVMVAEPTASGVSDFKRIAELIKGFGIPGAIIVNKWDINEDMTSLLEAEAERMGMRSAGRIPYDDKLARAMAEGIESFDALESPATEAIKASFHATLELI